MQAPLPANPQCAALFYAGINNTGWQPLVNTLTHFKTQYQLDDWLYYQLIRKTAQLICPKSYSYNGYTLCKWYLLLKSGYGTKLLTGNNALLLYVSSNDSIYDIPCFNWHGQQFVCLNSHDFAQTNFTRDSMQFAGIADTAATPLRFSFKINRLPSFNTADYTEKDLQFNFHEKTYRFKIKLTQQVQGIFANYPVVDFESYFNIPLSNETYNTLIPLLKKNIKGMSEEEGVDFLMRFTRFAFLYENDQDNFGKEKRMAPEETLLYTHSDCDDRAALFFYLLKQLYNLPVITLLYPTHVTIAVQFKQPVGKPVVYNGANYYICDPTAQAQNLNIGQMAPAYKNQPYQVVYAYYPAAPK